MGGVRRTKDHLRSEPSAPAVTLRSEMPSVGGFPVCPEKPQILINKKFPEQNEKKFLESYLQLRLQNTVCSPRPLAAAPHALLKGARSAWLLPIGQWNWRKAFEWCGGGATAQAVTVPEGWSARAAGRVTRDVPHPAPLSSPVASSLIRNQPRAGLIISSASRGTAGRC